MGWRTETLTDQLLGRMEKKKSLTRRPDEPDEVEITIQPPRFRALDTSPGLYDSGKEKMFGGINNRESVFDRQALFRYKNETANGEER